jgi:hypothetical protein
MRSRRRQHLSLSLAVLLAASGLILASNMGLMTRVDLALVDLDHWVSLPYRTDLSTAQDLCDAIGPSANLVARLDAETEARIEWSCPGGTNFALEPGEGFIVQVSTPTTLSLLGSHDPDLLVPPGGFVHPDRHYLISIPYHSTATVADDLCAEIPKVVVISRFDLVSGVQDWTCPFGDNFALRVGEAVRVQVSESSAGFVPEHF